MGTPFALRALAVAGVWLGLVPGCGKTDARQPPLVWHDLEEGEAIARRECKPALVFVHAEWSVADKMLEHDTFPARDVGVAMRGFVAIHVDATDDEAPATRRAVNRFGVIGVPAIIAVDDFDSYPNANVGYGNSNDLVRVNMYVDAKTLAASLRSAKAEFDRRGRCSA